ncbi:MAG: DMT family transporter [Bacillota bacterium]
MRAHPGFVQACVAALCFATAPVLTRGASDLPAVSIVSARLALAGCLILVLAALRRERLRLDRGRVMALAGVGLVTAAHFYLFAWAVLHTAAASALILVNLAPVFAALGAAAFLGERLSSRAYLPLGVTVAGTGLLAWGLHGLGQASVAGDLAALLSGVTYAAYALLARGLRQRFNPFTYAAGVYLAAALWLAPFALAAGAPVTPQAAVAVGLLAVIPTAIGHTAYQASLRLLPVTQASLIATQEVTGGALLVALVYGEAPPPVAIAGACIALGGLAWFITVSALGSGSGQRPGLRKVGNADGAPGAGTS